MINLNANFDSLCMIQVSAKDSRKWSSKREWRGKIEKNYGKNWSWPLWTILLQCQDQ